MPLSANQVNTVVLYMHLPSGAILVVDKHREIRIEGGPYPMGLVVLGDSDILAADIAHIGGECETRLADLNTVFDGAVATCQR